MDNIPNSSANRRVCLKVVCNHLQQIASVCSRGLPCITDTWDVACKTPTCHCDSLPLSALTNRPNFSSHGLSRLVLAPDRGETDQSPALTPSGIALRGIAGSPHSRPPSTHPSAIADTKSPRPVPGKVWHDRATGCCQVEQVSLSPSNRRRDSMKSKVMGALIVSIVLTGQTYGFGLLDSMLSGGCGCDSCAQQVCCEKSCGCDDGCCGDSCCEPSCGCADDCCADDCCEASCGCGTSCCKKKRGGLLSKLFSCKKSCKSCCEPSCGCDDDCCGDDCCGSDEC